MGQMIRRAGSKKSWWRSFPRPTRAVIKEALTVFAAAALAQDNVLFGSIIASYGLVHAMSEWRERTATGLRRTTVGIRPPTPKRQGIPDEPEIIGLILGDLTAKQLAGPVQQLVAERTNKRTAVLSSSAETDSSGNSVRAQTDGAIKSFERRYPGRTIDFLVVATGIRDVSDGVNFQGSFLRSAFNKASFSGPNPEPPLSNVESVLVGPGSFEHIVPNDPDVNFPGPLKSEFSTNGKHYNDLMKIFVDDQNRHTDFPHKKTHFVDPGGIVYFSKKHGFHFPDEHYFLDKNGNLDIEAQKASRERSKARNPSGSERGVWRIAEQVVDKLTEGPTEGKDATGIWAKLEERRQLREQRGLTAMVAEPLAPTGNKVAARLTALDRQAGIAVRRVAGKLRNIVGAKTNDHASGSRIAG